MSFFTPSADTPPWRRRGCVCLCEKHTWQRRRPITPTLHRLTRTPTPVSSPPLAPPCIPPSFLPSFPSAPRGEMDLCLVRVMSLLACWGLRVQRSELEELSHFVYNAACRHAAHESWSSLCIYCRSGIVYSLWSSPSIICFVFKCVFYTMKRSDMSFAPFMGFLLFIYLNGRDDERSVVKKIRANKT